MPPDAVIVHRLPGRLRLRLTELKNDPQALAAVAAGLEAIPGMQAVEANALTGSLLLRYAGPEAAILQAAAREGGFRLVRTTEEAIPDLRGRLDEGMRNLSRGLQTVTGGEVDLNGLLVVGLTLLAIHQAIEGNVMAPAAALLWNAYQAARMPPLDARRQAEAEPAPPAAASKTTTGKRGRRPAAAHRVVAGAAGANRSHRKGDTK